MAYTTIPAGSGGSGGGGGPAWVGTLNARASALSGGILGAGASSVWFSDFTDSGNTALTSAAGAPTATYSTTLDGGVVALASSTTINSVGAITPAGKPALISSATTKKIYGAWSVRFDGPVDANSYLRVGFTTPTNIGTGTAKYTWFGVMGATSTTKFCVEVYDGATDTNTATSTNIDTASFHLVEFYSDGTTGTWYLDGTAINVTSTMSAVGANPMTVAAIVVTTNTTSRTMSLDKMYASFLAQ